jgi:hypothetical protein
MLYFRLKKQTEIENLFQDFLKFVTETTDEKRAPVNEIDLVFLTFLTLLQSLYNSILC